MAQAPILQVEGTTYPRVYEISYSLYTDKDETGKPSDKARCGVIKITRESGDTSDLFRWATDSTKRNFKSGSITFKHPETKEDLKVLSWENGFVSYYEEHVPHVKHAKDDQMYEYFEISAEKITVGSDEINQDWESAGAA